MAGRLTGKIAIVTGAGSAPGEGIGNGKAAAIAYAREGASVLLVDNRVHAANETRQMIDDEKGECQVFEGDITRNEECVAMAERCLRVYDRIDILHNNVGINQRVAGGPLDVDEAEWDLLINTNLKSMFLTCRAVLPQMLKQGKGVILNITSIASIRVSYPQFIYSISKAGVNSLTRALAVLYADKGIRVNAVMPGLIETPLMGTLKIHYDGDLERMRRERSSVVPMKRMGTAWDVAYASVFLACDEAQYITGQILAVDGGYMCAGRIPR